MGEVAVRMKSSGGTGGICSVGKSSMGAEENGMKGCDGIEGRTKWTLMADR